MNSRERVLSLLSGSCPDRVPWFGDLDYWYSAAVKGNALDAKYLADGYFQLNRDLGVGFYLQGFSPFRVHHKGVSFSETLDHGEITVDSPAECIMIPETPSCGEDCLELCSPQTLRKKRLSRM